ncbi:protein CTR9 homolog [Oryza brachyantha]|uniref:protein CTR9 homolog n=1 Tax=Oryza brachyantha TaxID=4533 RepID=UPI001AD968CC|nr:protein CTR9 homolog [Oryza brachyantha]
MASVYIPVQGTEEEVRVALDQLPADASDILDILKAEQAPLHLWLIIAREYFKQGKIEQFRQILEEGSGPEIDEYYADVKYERIAILNALGAFHTFLGKVERAHQKEAHFKEATQYYNRASRIDETEPSTWIGRGQLCVAKRDLQMASDSFKIVLDDDGSNFPALLGQASVYFLMGDMEQQHKKALDYYRNSLDLYKRALRAYTSCPAAVRLGIAFCRYKLGQPDKARQAFQRVLQLDPENIDALVALAIMDLQTNEAGGIRRGMDQMRRAFEIYPYCTLALNHLANHYFFTGQHFVVEQLTETALSSSNHGLLKSHAFYNLARSYHSKGDIETAGRYYMASVNEISKPQDFVLPFFGLGQIQLKFADYKSSLASFEKVLEVHPENCESLKAIGHIYAKSGENDKAIETFKKVTRIDPKDHQAFMELGELLVQSDWAAAMEYLKTARNLLKKAGEKIPIELLNGIGLLHFEKGELEMAEQSFKEALGDGFCVSIIDGSVGSSVVNWSVQYRDQSFFHQLEEGMPLELPWDKVTTLFNYARLFEELHDTVKASLFYRLIIFKYPDYIDAYLRLAAIAKEKNNVQLSIELIGDALKIDDKYPNALSMLGSLELQGDETWLTAKEHFREAKDASEGKDTYSMLQLGNWNYFAANRPEKKAPKFEATHREKAKELYSNVLKQHRGNMFAANGIGILYAEKAQWDIAKELFTQVHEAASGSIFVQMPDVWINLAHIYFAQGLFQQAVKMYQNCLRKFFYNTDATILLYLARTHYEAEQWQDCRKTLLRAIHLAPSNYLLRFNVGVSMQKFSASTLQKTKRTVDEVRATVSELQNAIRVFSLLSVASTYHSHGFDERKIETHIEYCKHLLDAAKVHRDAAEQAEQQNKQKMEVARQIALADEARRKAEEQRKAQLERRKQEDELKQVMQQEQHFERVKEQWKTSSNNPGKRKDRSKHEDEEGGSEKRRRKGGRKRKDQKTKAHYGEEEEDEYRDEPEAEDDYPNTARGNDGDDSEKAPGHLLAAAGLEDSDAEDDMGHPQSAIERKRRAWSESEDDEPVQRPVQPSAGENDLSD